jgi:altronate hydrolase
MSLELNNSVISLHPDDNVCVAVRHLEKHSVIRLGAHELPLRADVPLGHKIAIVPVAMGSLVRKYGQPIGRATRAIQAGDWVHSHNLQNEPSTWDYAKATDRPDAPAPVADRTFMGYRRAGGRAGTRNYIAVISTVNCSASVSKYVAARFDSTSLKAYSNVDGVVAFTHDGGCAMPFGGLKHEMLNRVMGGIARHPNIGAFLMIGLGCEQATPGYLVSDQRLVQITGLPSDRAAPPILSIQDTGGTAATVEAGVRKLSELLPRANDVRREPIPASELVLATNCGGSDGHSGITANPALGAASDTLVACGGTAILGETPEIYGAEQLLTRRAVSVQVADKLIERIKWWQWYAGVFGAELDNNPSLGNKQGGLTTIAEKSLGAVAKGGSTALVEVYEYAEPVTAKGLVVMDTPGFDPMSVTGMVAGGANIIVFTTGRGSCYGCKPVPSIKVASNTPLFERMAGDMDIDAGSVIRGRSVRDVGSEIFEEMLAVASGKKTKSELHGIGDEEFLPWTVGPTL